MLLESLSITLLERNLQLENLGVFCEAGGLPSCGELVRAID
jgi:hypothetical protein